MSILIDFSSTLFIRTVISGFEQTEHIENLFNPELISHGYDKMSLGYDLHRNLRKKLPTRLKNFIVEIPVLEFVRNSIAPGTSNGIHIVGIDFEGSGFGK